MIFADQVLFRGSVYSGVEDDLKSLFNVAVSRGYRVIGPKLVNSVIRLEQLNDFNEIPYGYGDKQAPGYYRVVNDGGRFRHGPDSPKRFLYPPELLLFIIRPDLSVEYPRFEFYKTAFFGIKPCDLAAINVMDGVQGELGDEYYRKVRENLSSSSRTAWSLEIHASAQPWARAPSLSRDSTWPILGLAAS